MRMDLSDPAWFRGAARYVLSKATCAFGLSASI